MPIPKLSLRLDPIPAKKQSKPKVPSLSNKQTASVLSKQLRSIQLPLPTPSSRPAATGRSNSAMRTVSGRISAGPSSEMKSRLGGLSGEELWGRRESLLGSRFKQRKDRLETITKDNRRIYVKINSQKSLYSSKEMHKSFESSSQLSRNLSQSRISNRQAQLSTARSRLTRPNPPPPPPNLQSVPVSRVERA